MNEEASAISQKTSNLQISSKTASYGHWEVAANITKQHSSNAFTYLVWFPDLYVFYIGVKKLVGPQGKEYKWRTYTTSSQQVKQLLHDGYSAEFLITQWYDTYEEAVIAEAHEQTKVNAHTNPWCLNMSINGYKFFTPGPHSSKTKAKMSLVSLGKPKSAVHRANISKGQKGRAKPPRSVATKLNLSKAKQKTKNPRWRGYVHSPDGVFDTTIDASKHYNIHRETIRRRCENPQPKWNAWFFSPIQDQG